MSQKLKEQCAPDAGASMQPQTPEELFVAILAGGDNPGNLAAAQAVTHVRGIYREDFDTLLPAMCELGANLSNINLTELVESLYLVARYASFASVHRRLMDPPVNGRVN
jgi:hypothetical protein